MTPAALMAWTKDVSLVAGNKRKYITGLRNQHLLGQNIYIFIYILIIMSCQAVSKSKTKSENERITCDNNQNHIAK